MKLFSKCNYLALCILCFATLSARTWTNTQGQGLEAEYVTASDTAVTVKRTADGLVFDIPLASLSAPDQAFVKERLAAGEGSAGPEVAAGETADTPLALAFPKDGLVWPRRTSLPDDYEVEVVREDNEAGEYVYQTTHFEFRSNVKLQRKVVREFGKIFEGTFESVKAMPLHWQPQTPEGRYACRLFETKEQYYAAGGLENSGGSYSSRSHEILVPVMSLGLKESSSGFTLDSRNGDHSTLIHEITHQVHHEWLRQLPVWMTEGFAVFSENIPYDDGEFRYDRLEFDEMLANRNGSKDEFAMVPLENLMTMTNREWNEELADNRFSISNNYASAFVLFYYFTFLDGEGDGRPMFEYVRAVESGTPYAEAQQILMAGRSYEELEADLAKAIRREGIKVIFQ